MHYLIQVNLYLVVFFAFYRLFLSKETFYQANRFYLVISAIVSFLIPFFYTDWVQSWFVTQEVSEVFAAYNLDILEAPVVALSGTPFFTLGKILLGFYVIGVTAFSIYFGLKVYKTVKFINNEDSSHLHAYSFFGKTKVGKGLQEYKEVLDHEKLHAVQCHSFDVLLFEVVAVLCWFNPVVYLLKNDIKLLHEYQADEYASKDLVSKAEYAALLVGKKFGVKPELIMVNTFFSPSTLKSRIMMLLKERSDNRALLKYGLIAPIFLAMMVVASASIAKSDNISQIEKFVESTKVEVPIKLASKVVGIDLSEYENGGVVHTVKVDEIDFSFPPPAPPVETEKRAIVKEIKVIASSHAEIVAPLEDELFTAVENQPTFPGGDAARNQYLNKVVVYPAAASRANIQGRVTVQFVVEKDGSISSAKVLKGLGFGTDEAALDAINGMPKWNPGVQNGRTVRTHFTLPIVFTLNE